MQTPTDGIGIILLSITIVILGLAILALILVYAHHQKHASNQKSINEIKDEHQKVLMTSQLEIQEQTLQRVSRDIHDNISLSLTLTKLNLLTIEWSSIEQIRKQVKLSLESLSQSIEGLNDVSKLLSSDIIANLGLIAAVERETERVNVTNIVALSLDISGEPVFLNTDTELIIFRIIQESINNMLKHSQATAGKISLDYGKNILQVHIMDNGIGMPSPEVIKGKPTSSGLQNIKARLKVLGGISHIKNDSVGTYIIYKIPFYHEPGN